MTMHKGSDIQQMTKTDYILRKEEKRKRFITAANNSSWNISRVRKSTKTRKQKSGKKQLFGYFKLQIVLDKTWTRLQKGKLEFSLLQHKATRTNYVEAKIDDKQQNIKCMLCREKDETTNHIVSEISKLAKRSTKLDWERQVIN